MMIQIPEQKEYIADEDVIRPSNMLLRNPSFNSSASSFNTPIGGSTPSTNSSYIPQYTPYGNGPTHPSINNSLSITRSTLSNSNTPKIKDDNVIAKIDLNDDPFAIAVNDKLFMNNNNNNNNGKQQNNNNSIGINYTLSNSETKSISKHHTKKVRSQSNHDYHEKHTLRRYGYRILKTIAVTLQGKVVQAVRKMDNLVVVIKITNIKLHRQGVTIKNGKKIKVKENILKEKKIMTKIQRQNPPKGFIDIIQFFDDGVNYFLGIN